MTLTMTGKQKAAMLLLSLDTATASELLKDINPDIVRELAVELAYLDASGYSTSEQSLEYAKEFYSSLRKKKKFKIKDFLKEMLSNSVGQEKAEQIQSQIQDLLQQRDPFIPIRSADSQAIVSALKQEHPQAIAVVLSELIPKKSSEILKLLDDSVRLNVISRMTCGEKITPEAKMRIAEMACKRLESLTSGGEEGQQLHPEESLRKVAVILRNLDKELRDGLVSAIDNKDKEAAEKVKNLMIIWEDILFITDRSLQEVLREVDSRDLAYAITNAEEAIINKIKSNISERAAATLEEEISLMSELKSEDIQASRDKIVYVLRERNEAGQLTFIESVMS